MAWNPIYRQQKAEQFSFYYNFFPQAWIQNMVFFFFMHFVGLGSSKIKDDSEDIQFSGKWCCVAWWLNTDILVYPDDADSRLLWKLIGYISTRLCSRFSQKTVIFTADAVWTLHLIQENLFVKTGSYIFYTSNKLMWTSISENFQYHFKACLWTTLPYLNKSYYISIASFSHTRVHTLDKNQIVSHFSTKLLHKLLDSVTTAFWMCSEVQDFWPCKTLKVIRCIL